jgi:hypothetical protein
VATDQVRAAVEQGLGAVTTETVRLGPLDVSGCVRRASLAPSVSRFLSLRTDHRVDPAGQLMAALRAHEPGEGGVIQLVLQASPRSAGTRARGQARRLRAGRGLQASFTLRALQALGSLLGELIDQFTSGSSDRRSKQTKHRADPLSLDRAKAIDAKAAQPLLAVTLRIGAWGNGRRQAGGRLGGLLAAFGQFHGLGGLHKGFESFCKQRMVACLPAVKPRLLLSSSEAAALMPLPEESALAPLSFTEAPSRSIAPSAHAPTQGLLLGRSDHAGFDRDVRVQPVALLEHVHVLGPTGRGKSTLLLNMIVEAIRAGMGGMVLDPTGELTALILARVPAERVGDVELLDLGDMSRPPALNLLACTPGEGDAHAHAICGISPACSHGFGDRGRRTFFAPRSRRCCAGVTLPSQPRRSRTCSHCCPIRGSGRGIGRVTRWRWMCSGASGRSSASKPECRRSRLFRTSCARCSATASFATCSASQRPPTSRSGSPPAGGCSSRSHRRWGRTPPT